MVRISVPAFWRFLTVSCPTRNRPDTKGREPVTARAKVKPTRGARVRSRGAMKATSQQKTLAIRIAANLNGQGQTWNAAVDSHPVESPRKDGSEWNCESKAPSRQR